MEVYSTQNGNLTTPNKIKFYYGLEGEIRLPGLAITKQISMGLSVQVKIFSRTWSIFTCW